MPVKRRVEKRRVSADAELAAWRETFTHGHDFFGDASDYTGLTEPVHVSLEDRPGAARKWREAASEAWQRVGPAFLAEWTNEDQPWALQEFGEP